jgi:hypothetical protein
MIAIIGITKPALTVADTTASTTEFPESITEGLIPPCTAKAVSVLPKISAAIC